MTFPEKEIVLKDGRKYLLRSPGYEDGEAMLDYLKTCNGETEFVLRYPDEFWENAEDEGKFLQKGFESPLNLSIACFDGGAIAASCAISFNSAFKMRHRASVGIGVLKRYWGIGMAKAMMEELLKAAGEKEHVDTVELWFIEGNKRAEGLYRSLGFERVYARPDAVRLRSGESLSEIFMVKKL